MRAIGDDEIKRERSAKKRNLQNFNKLRDKAVIFKLKFGKSIKVKSLRCLSFKINSLKQGCKNAVGHSRRPTKDLECVNGICSDVAVPTGSS